MVKILTEEIKPFYVINESLHQLPVVISIPHSGEYIDQAMADKLINNTILPNTDWYLPKLYAFLKDLGFTIIVNNINRHLIDVNRSLEGLNSRTYKVNPIYPQTTQQKRLYQKKLSQEEKELRINNYYRPYHQAINQAIKEKQKHFDHVYLIDLHSFGLDHQSNVILGNDFDHACSYNTISFFEKLFQKNDLSVVQNYPFAGGYITKHYGKIDNCEALQIELWYRCYIDERRFGNEELPEINEEIFKQTQAKLEQVFLTFKEHLLQTRWKNNAKK